MDAIIILAGYVIGGALLLALAARIDRARGVK